MHHAIAFAIASESCRKRPFARNFRSENEFLTISFAKPFAIASELIRSAQFAAFLWRFGGQNSLANSWGVRIRIRIRRRIAATAVHSGQNVHARIQPQSFNLLIQFQ